MQKTTLSNSLFRRISIKSEAWRIPRGFLSCPDLKNATERATLMRRVGTARRKIEMISSMMIVASV
jgi:hypothetical protein